MTRLLRSPIMNTAATGLAAAMLLNGSPCLPWARTAAAAEPPPVRAAAESTNSADTGTPEIPWLENTRSYTQRATRGLVSAADGWFGDKPFDESGGQVSGYVRLGTLWEEDDGLSGQLRFRLHARLPNLQERAYVFIGRDNRDEEVADQPAQFSKEELLQRERRREDESFFAGLGYALHRNIDFRIGMHGALHPYVQARYRHQWQLSPASTVYLRESLFWSARKHFGSTTVLDYEQALSASLWLRWANVGTISQRSDGFEWQSSLGLFKELPGLREASVEALVQGQRKVDISDYGLRVAWRQPIYKDWLLGKVTIGHFWPRAEGERRHRSWAVGFSAEMQF